MKLLVVGGGGREHAIIKKLKENPSVETIYALPGNGGIAADAVCVPIGATDIPRIVEFAVQNGIDYAVVAPDDPLVLGAVDALTEKGIPCFGPSANAAIIGALMVLTPGVALTMGVRDILNGDYLSGSIRLLDALFIAGSIAGGVVLGWILARGLGVAV